MPNNAPNLPSHLALCQCDDCHVQLLAGVPLCAACREAGCEVEGGPCKANPAEVELLRQVTSLAGLELAAHGFRPSGWGGQVNYRGRLPDGRVAFVLATGEDYGPDNIFDPVSVYTDDAPNEPFTYATLADFIATLPRPATT